MTESQGSSRAGAVGVSVIIPAYNGPGDVIRAIRSLRAQAMAQDGVEVIVVDDGSEPPLEKEIGGELDDRRFRLVRLPANRGRGAARNAGAANASGDILVFMDSDMTAHPDLIHHHLQSHLQAPGGAFVGHVVWTGTSTLHRYLESRGVKKLAASQAVPWRYFDSSNCSIRKADLERAGYFEEEVRAWGGEDTALGYRLHANGIPLGYRREAIAYHHSRIDLDGLCRNHYAFGRYSLPVVIARWPEMAGDLHVHYLTPHRQGEKGRLRRLGPRLWVRGIIRFPGQRVVRSLLRASGRRLSFLCYDYLVYSSILRGYQDFLTSSGRSDRDGETAQRSAGPGAGDQGLAGVAP